MTFNWFTATFGIVLGIAFSLLGLLTGAYGFLAIGLTLFLMSAILINNMVRLRGINKQIAEIDAKIAALNV